MRLALPTSVTELGDQAFSRCASLGELIIPEDSRLETIGTMCFMKTALREVELPPGLKIVKHKAFFACENLKIVYSEGARIPGASDCIGPSVLVGYPKR